jgi:hypothetical protein
MPYLNVRWISLFAVSAAILLAFVSVVGFESFKEGTKNKDKFSKAFVGHGSP